MGDDGDSKAEVIGSLVREGDAKVYFYFPIVSKVLYLI